MMPRVFFLFFGLWSGLHISAQDVEFVRVEMEALADSSLFGRGYVNAGSERAADHLAERFDRLGVSAGDGGRFQAFPIRVNTFPHKTTLVFGDDTLRAGYDYLADPHSGSTTGTFEPLFLDSSDFNAASPPPLPHSYRAAVINTRGLNAGEGNALLFVYVRKALERAPVILIKSDKLTWSAGSGQYAHALLEVDINALGGEMPDSIHIDVTAVEEEMEVRNVIGKIPGARSDSALVITAHYDHLGMMGEAMFRGASDNASGTAMMLDLAGSLVQETPSHDIWFVAFAAEEAGLLGSTYFVNHPPLDLDRIKLLINLDLMGSAETGIAVVNGAHMPRAVSLLRDLNESADKKLNIKVRGNAPNSDHYPFTQVGVPAIFIYTEGNIRAYHDVHDVPEVVDWANYAEVYALIKGLIDLW